MLQCSLSTSKSQQFKFKCDSILADTNRHPFWETPIPRRHPRPFVHWLIRQLPSLPTARPITKDRPSEDGRTRQPWQFSGWPVSP